MLRWIEKIALKIIMALEILWKIHAEKWTLYRYSQSDKIGLIVNDLV